MNFHKLHEHIREVLPGDSSLGDVMRDAQKFYAGEMRQWSKPGRDYEGAIPRLPFRVCAFEFSLEPAVSYFAIATETEESTRLAFWAMRPSGFIHVGRVEMFHDGKRTPKKWPDDSLLEQMGMEGVTALIRGMLHPVWYFVSVLNCRNVVLETVAAPDALNKKRARKGRPPLYSYHVLALKSQTRRVELGGTHASPRIHLRRGHIKRRKTGNFWWEPCAVGDRRRGVVMKDYRADELAHA